MAQYQYLDTFSPFDGTNHTRFIIDEMGMFPIGKEPKFKPKRPVWWPRIPRKQKGEFYIPKYGQKSLGKGLYEQMNSKGKLVRYSKNIDLSWMKPVVWKFTPVGKKTTNLIKKLYGRRIRK